MSHPSLHHKPSSPNDVTTLLVGSWLVLMIARLHALVAWVIPASEPPSNLIMTVKTGSSY